MTPKADSQLINLSGKAYLKVPGRVEMFRADHPEGGITTELISTDPRIIVRAEVHGEGGVLIATAYGTAPMQGMSSWKGREIEKAETAAVGRALGFAGYGTLAAFDDDDRDNLADAPIDPPHRANAAPAPSSAAGNGHAAPVNGWTPAIAAEVSAYATDELGMNPAQVKHVLAVDRLSQFEAGPDMARQMLKAHADKQAVQS